MITTILPNRGRYISLTPSPWTIDHIFVVSQGRFNLRDSRNLLRHAKAWFSYFPTVPDNENSKSYISPIVWDERGQIWRIRSVSIFPTRPRFLRWSAIIPDKWKLKFVPSGTSASFGDGFQSPVPLSQINVSFLENLAQTSGEYLIYRQNLG